MKEFYQDEVRDIYRRLPESVQDAGDSEDLRNSLASAINAAGLENKLRKNFVNR